MSNDQLFHKRKIQKEKELARCKNKKERYVTLLIVGEGKTEFNYFNDLKRCFRHMGINIILEKPKGSAPKTVVESVVNYANKNEGIDHVFCIIDRDEHPSYSDAVDRLRNYQSPRMAKSKPKFKTISSFPCFEIWPLLHFVFSSKSYSKSGNKSAGDHVVTDLQEHFPEYSKNMSDLFSKLRSRLRSAIQNAKRLLEHNQKVGSKNPSTQMHELIDFIFELTNMEY